MVSNFNSNSDKYKLSFIGADLALSESIKIAEVYLQLKDWDAVKEKVKTDNVLQARTQSSVKRIYRELSKRLAQLSDEQMELLVEGTIQEQKQILWFAICESYEYIRDFAIEVLREKFLSLDYELTDFDYNAFFNRKADWHEELDELKETSRKKMKQIIFRMLKEAELITEDSMIIATIFSKRFVDIVAPDSPNKLQIFPISMSDIPW